MHFGSEDGEAFEAARDGLVRDFEAWLVTRRLDVDVAVRDPELALTWKWQ